MPNLRVERVVVTGGRGFTDQTRIEADLRALLPLGLKRVAHGGAPGADRLTDSVWRRMADLPLGQDVISWTASCRVYPADWKPSAGKSAGPLRNKEMLDTEKPDLVLAYPDERSRGTWHCVKEACKRGITVALWAPEFAVWEFEGEDEFKPGIYVDGARGVEAWNSPAHTVTGAGPRFVISTFSNLDAAERLVEALRG